MPRASGRYSAVYERSLSDPSAFWLEAAHALSWDAEPSHAAQPTSAGWDWFSDGELNLSYNAVDRHVLAGRGEATALIYDSAMTGVQRSYSYSELQHRVSLFAGVLAANAVTKGDRVVIYMPMVPEAVIAMLACARIGAIHSVVFGGFAANELAVRLDDASPKLVVTSSGGLEPGKTVAYLPLVEQALALSTGSVETVLVHDRAEIQGSAADYAGHPTVAWLDWESEELRAKPVAPVSMASTDPLYILYTSGTTGSPKGVVRDTGGYGVALAWSMANIYDVGPGDVIWTASDVGWVVGHSYIVYGPLLAGATTVLYEGKPVGTPDAGAFWRMIDEHRVNVLYTAPTALRAIRRVDPMLLELQRYDTSTLRAVYLAGERLDPDTYHWANDGLGCPIVDHWWQTETGWPISANPRGIEHLPAKPGSSTVPMPGYRIEIVDARGTPTGVVGEEGNIAIRLPLPPGAMTGLWGSEDRYRTAYLMAFPGFYATGDSGHFDDEGYLYVMGRTDDVINVAGHRLSTGSLEEVIALHPAVAESAVVGLADALKGQRAAAFVTLKAGETIEHDQLAAELVALVREKVGPVAAFRDVTIVERLPKTRSGKILRKTIRQIVDGEPYVIPATIEDPSVLDSLMSAHSRRERAKELK